MTEQPSDHPPAPPERLSEERLSYLIEFFRSDALDVRMSHELLSALAELREHRARERQQELIDIDKREGRVTGEDA